MNYVWIYLVLMNLFSCLLMGYDKSQARNKGWRVPEKLLFGAAALGGAAGAWLGMRLFRHKTRHVSFTLGMPLLIVLNAACVYWLSSHFMY